MGSRRPSRGCLLGAGPELRGTGWRLRESPWAEEAMVKDGMRMRISTREEGCRGRRGRARACAPPSEFEGHLTVNRTSLAAFRQVSCFKKLMLSNWVVELCKCQPGGRGCEGMDDLQVQKHSSQHLLSTHCRSTCPVPKASLQAPFRGSIFRTFLLTRDQQALLAGPQRAWKSNS